MRARRVEERINEFFTVGVGASAGGLESFQRLLESLPSRPGMAFILVQHLNPSRSSQLTEILSQATAMPVMEVKNNMLVKPNHVFIIPPNKKMTLSNGVLKLAMRTGDEARPTVIDRFFSSLAQDQGARGIGIVLSGTGSDGARGLFELKAAGGITFAQDKTAKFGSMPQGAIANGSVDFVLAPSRMAAELVRIGKMSLRDDPAAINRDLGSNLNSRGPSQDSMKNVEVSLHQISDLILKSTGTDFSHYKRGTLSRRIARRMLVLKIEGVSQYLRFMKVHPGEAKTLAQDLLIHVTSFFRDPEVFDELKKLVFPRIMRAQTSKPRSGKTIKFWVVGCSTGEEVYSLAITLLEFLGSRRGGVGIQIFGTDLSKHSIEKARAGVYTQSEVYSVSAKRLKTFFVKKHDGYQVNKAVRDICVFAQQNVTSDPPFSGLDLISCRNLLIYFEASLQNKVIPLFHYGLKSTGYLVLGNAEAIGSFSHLFCSVSKKCKIFSKKLFVGRSFFDFSRGPILGDSLVRSIDSQNASLQTPTSFQKEMDLAIMGQLAPAGIVINEDGEIIQVRGHTGDYLEPPSGKVTSSLMKMARADLRAELHMIIRESLKRKSRIKRSGIRFKLNQRWAYASIEAFPFKISGSPDPYLLILFAKEKHLLREAKVGSKGLTSKKSEVVRLAEALAVTQDYLQSAVEHEQTLNEELKTTNEEILSSNEELQSTNEELETAKEELQSSNEELMTLNDELQNRNRLLIRVNTDLGRARRFSDAIIQTIREPLLVLDRELRVTRANQCFYETFQLKPEATKNKRIYDLGGGQLNIPQLKHLLEEILPKDIQFFNFEVSSDFPKIGKRSMLLNARQIHQDEKEPGQILLVIEDVTNRLDADRRLKKASADLMRANKDLEQFAYVASHDLQEPLRTITTHMELLMERPQEHLDPVSQELVTSVIAAAKRLQSLVKELLHFSLTSREVLNYEPVDCGEIVQKVIADLVSLVTETEANVVFSKLPVVMTDKALLGVVFQNLISNSIKFRGASTPEIHITARQSGDEWHFAVKDNGIGIEKDYGEKIFLIFQRLHGSSEYPGSGIGLAICKKLIERFGGKISFDSKLGEGTTFHFTLPIHPVHPEIPSGGNHE